MSFISTFLTNKGVGVESFEIRHNGTTHYLDTEVVIEQIENASPEIQEKVKDKLIELDYHNAPIEPFIKYLAQGIVERY